MGFLMWDGELSLSLPLPGAWCLQTSSAAAWVTGRTWPESDRGTALMSRGYGHGPYYGKGSLKRTEQGRDMVMIQKQRGTFLG